MEILYQTIETALNHYLSLDSTTLQRIEKLSGKVVALKLTAPTLDFYLELQGNKIKISQEYIGESNTQIKGPATSFIAMKLSSTTAENVMNSGLEITGDLELGQAINDIFNEIDIDWEEHLSHYVGDILAYNVIYGAKKIKQIGSRLKNNFCQNSSEFLHEEVRYFPPTEEINDFIVSVDELRSAVDRQSMRIKRLKEHLKLG